MIDLNSFKSKDHYADRQADAGPTFKGDDEGWNRCAQSFSEFLFDLTGPSRPAAIVVGKFMKSDAIFKKYLTADRRDYFILLSCGSGFQ